MTRFLIHIYSPSPVDTRELSLSVQMVKPLIFKGDKKPKKRKHPGAEPARPTDADATVLSNDKSAHLHPSTTKLPLSKSDGYNNSNNQDSVGGGGGDNDADDNNEDDTWVDADAVTDVAGPIVLVLPTEPPTALASDVNGSIFASQLENMVDGNARTVEPHEVRQVWVATRVAGTETWSLKGHHGKYVSPNFQY